LSERTVSRMMSHGRSTFPPLGRYQAPWCSGPVQGRTYEEV
jgi:hypothetical protein